MVLLLTSFVSYFLSYEYFNFWIEVQLKKPAPIIYKSSLDRAKYANQVHSI